METEDLRGPYIVRWARETEWAPAMKMIWKTFLKFEGKDYTSFMTKELKLCRATL